MYPDLMVDLETTGTDPVNNAIIQIAAVRFNRETGEIGPMFDMSLDIAYGRFWDEGTREWWMKHIAVYQKITAVQQPPALVMQMFRDWCIETGPALAGVGQRLWAKPIHFEWPFIQSYCRQFGVELPFHYRHAMDLNSYLRGLESNPGAMSWDKKIEFQGTPHNAIDDVLHQIRVLLAVPHLLEKKDDQPQ